MHEGTEGVLGEASTGIVIEGCNTNSFSDMAQSDELDSIFSAELHFFLTKVLRCRNIEVVKFLDNIKRYKEETQEHSDIYHFWNTKSIPLSSGLDDMGHQSSKKRLQTYVNEIKNVCKHILFVRT